MRRIKHGDTLIEVVFSFMVFSTVSVASISIMNSGLNQAQRSLEVTMARNTVDSQAEAIRFLHNSFAGEREYAKDKQQYTRLWRQIVDNNIMTVDSMKASLGGQDLNDVSYDTCQKYYDQQIYTTKAFVINTHLIHPRTALSSAKYDELVPMIVIKQDRVSTSDPANGKVLRPSSLYPRLTFTTLMFEGMDDGLIDRTASEDISLVETKLYREVHTAEGIWISAIEGDKPVGVNTKPQYYDFYIRTCWQSVGTKAPSTLSTIIRLYNPEAIE